MRLIFLIVVIFLVHSASAQCPFSVRLNGNGSCLGATLNVSTSSTLNKIVWYNGGSIVKIVMKAGVQTVAGGNGAGSAGNQVSFPEGLYVDAAGDVYVTDAYNNRVQKWPPGATSGTTVVGGNGLGSAANQLYQPLDVYADAAGNLYVADDLNARVQKWAPGASAGVTVAGGNGLGPGANQFMNMGRIVVDGAGNIYISDRGNQRIQKWAPGATSGVTVAGGNGIGSAANQLDDPIGIWVDAAGNLYIADSENQRIQKWAPGATSGVTVAGGNGAGSAANQFIDPIGIWVDAAGNLYIADELNNRVQQWAPGAASGVTVAGGNGPGSAADQLDLPTALALDADGNIYVSDAQNQRVQKFYVAPFSTSYTPAAAGVYTAVVTDNNGCSVTTNAVTINAAVTPSISISQTTATLCSNTPVFTAVAVGGGSAPVYQWLLNGASVGANSPTYANNNLQHRDQVGCVLTGNAQCATTPTAVSNDLIVSLPAAITLSNKGSNCAGADTLLLSSPDPLAQIVWQNEGNTLSTVSAAPVLDTSYKATTPGSYTAVVATSTGCNATSDPIVVKPTSNASVSISTPATTVCSGVDITFTANLGNEGISPGGAAPNYQWQVNGINTGTNSPSYVSNALATGDVITCRLISDAICFVSADASSNGISMTLHPTIDPVVNIATSSPVICAGDPVDFTAMVTGGGMEPAYQWQVNGHDAGDGSPVFSSKDLNNEDLVSCRYTSNSGCGDTLSNDIKMVVNPLPEMTGGQTTIQAGETIPLLLQATGDIISYSWSPDYTLSDSALPDPMATPAKTTTYTLQVTTAEGCKASATLVVNVIRDLMIPSAFTPNGDGKNDIFYVLGGPAGSEVKDLSVYNRWGRKLFQAHDVPPGDPAFGWNGAGAPAGSYVYAITIKFKEGSQQILKGTLLLVR